MTAAIEAHGIHFLDSPVSRWPDLLLAWLTDIGILKR